MANSECKACQRPSQLFLCGDCETELADLLTELITDSRTKHRIPGILQDLQDAAAGQTRFGGGNRRDCGDDAPIRFSGRARDILADIRALLVDWASRLAKHTGIVFVPMDGHDTAAYALWLAHNAHTIAAIPTANRLLKRLRHLTKTARHCVDRPAAPLFCGQCDTMMPNRKICGLALYAARDAIEVRCPNPACRTLHNIEKLYNRTLNSADNKAFPKRVLVGNQRTDTPESYTTGIMGELDEFVSSGTFDRWLREKRFKPARYLRPCGQCTNCKARLPHLCEKGRRGFFRRSDSDIPEYLLADLRKVRRAMERKTGKVKA